MSLWLCLHFAQLPLQALSRQQADQQIPTVVMEVPTAIVEVPTAIVERQRVIQACDAATALGIKPDMGIATVRALADNCLLLEVGGGLAATPKAAWLLSHTEQSDYQAPLKQQPALARRCGKEFVHFLRQVLGTAYDEQPDFQPPQQFSDHYWFGYEVKTNRSNGSFTAFSETPSSYPYTAPCLRPAGASDID